MRHYTRILAKLWSRQNKEFRTAEKEQRNFEQIQKHEKILWERVNEDDPIKSRVEECVLEMEKTCRLILLGNRNIQLLKRTKPE